MTITHCWEWGLTMRRLRTAITTATTGVIAWILTIAVGAVTFLVLGTGPAAAAPDDYTPGTGARFNNPYGTLKKERAIVRHINRSIDSTPKKSRIRIASWNVRSPNITAALIRAHRRGVSVQVLMDVTNADDVTPNRDVYRLKRAFRGDEKRPVKMRSWLRKCRSSCRGVRGIPHSKFYLFSRAGDAKYVAMYGSANATELSATIQWNDLYTLANAPNSYQEFLRIFRQMKADRPVRQGYVRYRHGGFTKTFYPYTGAGASGDPVRKILDKVKCKGATGSTGVRGRTQIRIAQTAMYGPRGVALAKEIAGLQSRGCNIRIVYAMFGTDALGIMRRAGVPLTHLAYDADDDGIYDRYIHMKSMTISGNYGGDTSTTITWNGSANWSTVALESDEIVGRWNNRRITRKYAAWIDYLFTHRPASWLPDGQRTTDPLSEEITGRGGVDPYAIIKQDL
ncbi:MAG: phospholipase D-like domain-containing protein [Nocardioides sp.]